LRYVPDHAQKGWEKPWKRGRGGEGRSVIIAKDFGKHPTALKQPEFPGSNDNLWGVKKKEK